MYQNVKVSIDRRLLHNAYTFESRIICIFYFFKFTYFNVFYFSICVCSNTGYSYLCSKVQMICIRSSDATATPSLASAKSGMAYLSGDSLPRLFWKTVKRVFCFQMNEKQPLDALLGVTDSGPDPDMMYYSCRQEKLFTR